MMAHDAWLFHKVYLGRYARQMDFACVYLSDKLREQIAPQHWFFMRYFDTIGPHLRIRWIGAENRKLAESEIFQDIVEDLLCDLVFAPPSSYRPLVNFGNPREFGEGEGDLAQAFTIPDEYDPEFEAFLGPEHMDTAHQVFEVSSEIALAVLKAELEGETSRKSIAPLLMKIAIDVFCERASVGEFLESYCQYWMKRDDVELGHLVADFELKAQSLRDSRYHIDEVPQPYAELAERWRECLLAAAAAYGDSLPDRRGFPDNLLFRFLHLMNNRLGINIMDEAYLAVVLKVYYDAGEW